jgi:hypothetical protein
MILYVNGDSHSSGAEAVNRHCFANDDSVYWQPEYYLKPHPDNLEVSYGNQLAKMIGAELYCDASAAGSNYRIIRTTKDYLKNNRPDVMIIGWSTWEREEWYDEETEAYFQVNCSGIDQVPDKWALRYKNFIANCDWDQKTMLWHEEIWNFHNYLDSINIPHLFFNCHSNFYYVEHITKKSTRYNYGHNYIRPYDNFSYLDYLIPLGYKHTKYHHFGPDAHRKWAEFLLPYLTKLL